jgi:hypothetical protein
MKGFAVDAGLGKIHLLSSLNVPFEFAPLCRDT